eukprot:2034086-Rhodomonas_salina.1
MQELGSDLLVVIGEPEKALPELVRCLPLRCYAMSDSDRACSIELALRYPTLTRRLALQGLPPLRFHCRLPGSDLSSFKTSLTTKRTPAQTDGRTPEQKAEERVQAALSAVKCNVEAVWGCTLFHLDDAPFG